MTQNRALITGITGQDSSFLSELLLSKGYEVYGIRRRTSTRNTGRIAGVIDQINLLDGDLSDGSSLIEAVRQSKPTEVYNLGAQSFVGSSFVQPEVTANITGLGTLRLLEAVKQEAPEARFYQASSSEMFGSQPPPQSESTIFHPRSPYGVAKVYAYWMTVNYREAYGMHASNGILFNHESHRRGSEFVTQKIAQGVASIVAGVSSKLYLGNLDAKRDWGHSKDFCEAMWLMLQQDKPDDYVICTGEAHTVREFVELAFSHVGLDYNKYVEIDPRLMRPAEVDYLLGDYSKAKKVLGWNAKTTFVKLVHEMVDRACSHPEDWNFRKDG